MAKTHDFIPNLEQEQDVYKELADNFAYTNKNVNIKN